MMPPIGRLVGHIDFSSLFINLGDKSYDSLAAAKAAGAPTLNYGLFPEFHHKFSHRSVVRVSCGSAGESLDEEARACCSADNERVSAMRHDHSPRGKALRALHGATRLSSTGLN
jgi:hypothetical protein